MDLYSPDIGAPDSKKIIPENIDWKEGVLVRSTNWLGDACMTLPAVFKIKEQMPKEAKLNIMCPANLKSFWETFPWVNSVIGLSGKRASKDDKQKVKKLNCGVAVVLPNSFGSGLDISSCGIPVRVGRGGCMRSMLLTHKLPKWKRIAGKDKHHQLREYLQLAGAMGNNEWNDSYEPAKTEVSSDRIQELGIDEAKKWLVLAPGAKFGPAKQWPVEYYGAVAKWWLDLGEEVIIIGTPDETEVAESVKTSAGGGVNLAGKTNLQELMFLLGKAALAVVNDSGAMHLSAAMGGKGVAVFGSTDPRATGPLGGKWKIIWNRIDCSPCLKKVCEIPEKDYDCLKGVKPNQVIEALKVLEHA
ncbi:MAG: lipopolysaccharide heptosyltransferase II [Lentisphaeraceae bacterium]|nr:lipopolysaccharide heptosyltransferase II [Lentisphaeraceae bacterium]